MNIEEFENIVESILEQLPEKFHRALDNIGIVVEDYPDSEIIQKMNLPSRYHLLGLYQGIPLNKRTTSYGMYPVVPDKISLYKRNIESQCRTIEEIKKKIYEVLIHEIGHYFGMSEEEIRKAGF